MKLGGLKSEKPQIFKFVKGQFWDGDEMIIHCIEDILLDENSIVKQDTYISLYIAKKYTSGKSNEVEKKDG